MSETATASRLDEQQRAILEAYADGSDLNDIAIFLEIERRVVANVVDALAKFSRPRARALLDGRTPPPEPAAPMPVVSFGRTKPAKPAPRSAATRPPALPLAEDPPTVAPEPTVPAAAPAPVIEEPAAAPAFVSTPVTAFELDLSSGDLEAFLARAETCGNKRIAARAAQLRTDIAALAAALAADEARAAAAARVEEMRAGLAAAEAALKALTEGEAGGA